MTDNGPVQRFQRQLPVGGEQFFNIPVVMEIGMSFILWVDVELVVENARYVEDAGTIIPFMKDSNQNVIMPKRIEYQPNVILKVVEREPFHRIGPPNPSLSVAGSNAQSTPNPLLTRLRAFVTKNDGMLDEVSKKVYINIASSSLAKEFYQTLPVICGIEELDIKLDWDVYKNDLRDFSEAMINSSIIRLILNGEAFTAKGPFLDWINTYKRFDPLIELLCQGNLQRISLVNFTDAKFFSSVSAEILNGQQSRVQILSIYSPLHSRTLGILDGLLGMCAFLKELELTSSEAKPYKTFDYVKDRLPETLQTLKLYAPLCSTEVIYSGEDRTMRMTTRYTKANESALRPFFATGLVIELEVVCMKDKDLRKVANLDTLILSGVTATACYAKSSLILGGAPPTTLATMRTASTMSTVSTAGSKLAVKAAALSNPAWSAGVLIIALAAVGAATYMRQDLLNHQEAISFLLRNNNTRLSKLTIVCTVSDVGMINRLVDSTRARLISEGHDVALEKLVVRYVDVTGYGDMVEQDYQPSFP
ncbi:hypothetical protein BGX28_002390 [Mortierella sp. GBA30]|nr:hypothetical protein BGX28_002390 [Mortierella sp. GBA30]